jgi:phosphonate transport system substrate-binding protein
VVNGLASAGGGVEKTLQEQDPSIRDALKVLYTTREMPSHPIAAHPRVPKEVREKLRSALLEFGAAKEGREMLAKVPMEQVVSTSIDDYAAMRTWGLESLWVDE